MRIRDKIITAACLTPEGIEWTSLKLRQEGAEPDGQGTMPLAACRKEHPEEAALASVVLPDGIAEQLKGDVTASIRTSELLMRTMEFPTIDPEEIAGMVGFQIDKISPFPFDQLAVSHEILRQTETSALVLMVAVKRACIDSVGDTFGEKNIHIHSMDARMLGWLHLLGKNGHLSEKGCDILMVDDGVDFALAVLSDGVPVAFRALQANIDAEDVADEIAHEIGYTLTMLDAEIDLPSPKSIAFWSFAELPLPVAEKLKEKTGLSVCSNDLAVLPPLSEGIIDRALDTDNRIELIPREWVDHEKNKRLRKKFAGIAAAIVGTWLCFLLVFIGIYQARAIKLSAIQKKANEVAPTAAKALENREKLKALKVHADQSNSALECLREVTRLLPAADIEFGSYNYNKDKGVSLRGTADTDDAVYDFFSSLTDSDLFERLKDQTVKIKDTKGVQRAVFSVALELLAEEEE